MPPILDPTDAANFSIPNESMRRNCERIISSIVSIGNLVAYLFPSEGSIDAGPVLPKHDPMILVHITKYLSVSMGAPGPMNFSHHPGWVFVLVLFAWDDADRPVCSKIALLLSALSSPHVSYAIVNWGRIPPQSRRSGSLHSNVRWWPVV